MYGSVRFIIANTPQFRLPKWPQTPGEKGETGPKTKIKTLSQL